MGTGSSNLVAAGISVTETGCEFGSDGKRDGGGTVVRDLGMEGGKGRKRSRSHKERF